MNHPQYAAGVVLNDSNSKNKKLHCGCNYKRAMDTTFFVPLWPFFRGIFYIFPGPSTCPGVMPLLPSGHPK